MERKRAVKKAGGDATASTEERGDPQTQGEEAPLQLKPCPSERTWQGLLVYSRKALYERKHSLQSPRLKRRKSRRSLLLPQIQLVAKIMERIGWWHFAKCLGIILPKTWHGSYWAMAKRTSAGTWDGSGQHHSQHHLITLTRCYTGKSGLPEASGQWLLLLTGPAGLNLEHTGSLSLSPPQKSLLARLKFTNFLQMLPSKRSSCVCQAPGRRIFCMEKYQLTQKYQWAQLITMMWTYRFCPLSKLFFSFMDRCDLSSLWQMRCILPNWWAKFLIIQLNLALQVNKGK